MLSQKNGCPALLALFARGRGFMQIAASNHRMHVAGGWPTFTFFVKVGTHAADEGILISVAGPPLRGWPTLTFFVKVGTHVADEGILISASRH